MVHIAAQGDQPVSIVISFRRIFTYFVKAYFQFKGLDIEEIDTKGSTPLHWAAFLGYNIFLNFFLIIRMENAVTYLLTWGASPNAQDKEFALTPLHLGALSGNPRIVRRLLSNGANKNKRVKKNIYGF